MTAGACIGFAAARVCGRPIVVRLTNHDELVRLERLTESLGPAVLVVTRALPVLAEASVLLFGAARLSWGRFLRSIALANLGIALAYAAFGSYAREHGATAAALVASIVLPLVALLLVRLFIPAERAANA
jgi:membrane protein DedA with SNARE-associated domain